MRSLVGLVVAIAIAGAVVALAVRVFRFNRKRRHVIRAARHASDAQLEAIYTLIERCGELPAEGYVLARTNRTAADPGARLPIAEITDFPWSGRTIGIEVGRDVVFRFVNEPAAHPTFLGRIYRPVAVPRIGRKNGKAQNNFSPERHLARSQPLGAALSAVCPDDPRALLSYLLCPGRESHEFEPIDQARIGTSPAWVQDPEWPTCESCSGRLVLIAQLPGTMLSERAFRRGTFFLFGCKQHPESTKSLGQFT